MSDYTSNVERRKFLKVCGFSAVPFLWRSTIPSTSLNTASQKEAADSFVHFTGDGLSFSPQEYLQKLGEIDAAKPIQGDFYGNGGATKELEETFAQLTGKEKAIFVPSGTMANQLAIKLLNGEHTKVIVPENSHIFRDEADAAQAVHNKRLIPVGKDKAYFDLQDLKASIDYYNSGEVFKSGLGTIVVENPIRRAEGTAVPLATLKEISTYCRSKGYRLHLDGARIHIASAFTGVSVREYASYFDTVYISLYKYLNASGGAILCGDAELVDKMSHQIKIFGGTTFQTWNQSAMALHYLNGIESRWKKVVDTAQQLWAALDRMEEFSLSKINNGTNKFPLKIADSIQLKKLGTVLYREHKISLPRSINPDGSQTLTINESILHQDLDQIILAFKNGKEAAKK